jgi:carbonic anhydrase
MAEFPKRLVSGYATFRDGRLSADRDRYRELAERGQCPTTMIVACCDSRSAPETIFDAAPGELFVHRNVANLVPPFEVDSRHHGTSAALEFGVTALKVRHIVVLGHGKCGGISAFLSGDSLEETDFIGRWIGLIAPAAKLIADDPIEEADRQRALEFASIRQGLTNLRTFPWVAAAEEAGSLLLHGAWFNIASGELFAMPAGEDVFSALV